MPALARLAHSLASNLQAKVATIVVPSRFCHGSPVIRALSKEHHSSEARLLHGLLCLYINIYVYIFIYRHPGNSLVFAFRTSIVLQS